MAVLAPKAARRSGSDVAVIDQHPEELGFGRLFWLTSEAIVGADLDTQRIIVWNPAAQELFGYPASEAVGMALEALVPDELRSDHLAGIARYAETGVAKLVGTGRVEVPARRRSGELIDVALSITDISDADGRVVVAIIRDISEVRRAQRELQLTAQAMREFVATASHDLRTPLAAVLGFSKLLEDSPAGATVAEKGEVVDAIVRGAKRASRLVDDLLTLSQVDAESVPTRCETVDPAGSAKAAVMLTGVDAAVEIGDGVAVLADPDHVERILTNYLANAARYGEAPIAVRATRIGDAVELRVVDAGAGVPVDFVDRLFTRFARADASSPDGTGLGLAIVAGLATANGGNAFYEMRPAEGATFGVLLPAAVP